MLKLGVNTGLWSYAGFDLEEACKDISNLGLKYVDLFTRLNCDPTNMNFDDMKKVSKKIKKYGLIVSSICSVIPVNFLDSEQNKTICLKYINKNFELSEILDTRLVLIKNGGKVLGKDYEKCWSESLEFMRNVCREGKRKGLILILEMEPLMHSLTNSVATSQRYLNDLGVDNFLMNIDIGHFFIVKDGPEEIKKLSGSIAHIHIVDDNGTNDTNDVLGTGKVPISDYINACIESGIEDTCQRYNVLPVAAMEIGSFRRPVYQPKNEAKMSLEFLKENLSYLELK